MTNTNVTSQAQSTKLPAVVAQFRTDLSAMESQFKMALPPHISVERFTRTILTAVQNNAKLLACTRQSLFNACMKAAQVGLYPDGVEGVIVPFGESEDGQRKSSDNAVWIPMIQGLRKLARNSGLLVNWEAHVVFKGDQFDYQLGDEPYLKHKPSHEGGQLRPVTHAYSVAWFPDGSISREVMTIRQIEEVRDKYARSKKKGPWSDPVAFSEMCRKTVARRHSKSLPKSSDLELAIRQGDEALFDVNRVREDVARERQTHLGRPGSVIAALDIFGGGGEDGEEDEHHDRPETEKAKETPTPDQPEHREPPPRPEPPPHGEPPPQPEQPPKTAVEYIERIRKRIAAATTFDAAKALEVAFVSDQARGERNKAGVVKEQADECRRLITEHVASFKRT